MHVNNFKTELQFAFGDACHIQQVVDQAGFQFNIAPDHFESFPQFGRTGGGRLQFADHRDHRGERVAQFVRKKREELIFGRVRIDQLLPESDVASPVVHQVKDALNRFVGRLQTQKRNVDEVSHVPFVPKWLLDQLKWRAEGENPLNRINRCNLHIVVGRADDLTALA